MSAALMAAAQASIAAATGAAAPGAAAVRIERQVRRAGGIRLHYREAGPTHAPALVLLHPSPRSSAMFEPWMQMLAPDFHVLAIDTPGYGASDPLPIEQPTLADYLGPLRELLLALAGPRFLIYGSATGAQLGIAYANAHAGDVAHLLIDNAAHFDEAQRAHILAHYFPDLSPRADGSHLLVAWRMAAQMLKYFPWFEANEAHRISPHQPSADEVNACLTELLAAGPGYAAAYRAAFLHEHARHVLALRVPTTLLRWQGSILLRQIDQLMTFELPPNVSVLHTPADLSGRYALMGEHLRALARATGPAAVVGD